MAHKGIPTTFAGKPLLNWFGPYSPTINTARHRSCAMAFRLSSKKARGVIDVADPSVNTTGGSPSLSKRRNRSSIVVA